MKGSIINAYFYCKRKAWLNQKRINMEQNSEDVSIGKVLHELNETKNSEISIDDIKIDSLTDMYIVEIKKSDSDILSATCQLKYYLYVLDKKGVKRNGKIKIIEKNKITKDIMIEYNSNIESEVERMVDNIELFLNLKKPPSLIEDASKCKKCSYRDYCYI